jgi:predicted DNA-binding transcriptional regulator AlpA
MRRKCIHRVKAMAARQSLWITSVGTLVEMRMSRRARKVRSIARQQPDLFSYALEHDGAQNYPPANGDTGAPDQRPPPREVMVNQGDSGKSKVKAAQLKSSIRPTKPNAARLLDVRAAAAWLGLSKSTLDKMRCYGQGPRFIRATGRAVRYDPDDLAAFLEGRRQNSTSETLPDSRR